MPKQAKTAKIKSLYCYTIQEAADVSGVSAHTIRLWSKDGLRLMDSARPVLIRGDDLRTYITSKRVKRRIKTAPDEFYCVRCRHARRAAGDMADCVINGSRASLTALCATCETVVYKPVSRTKIKDLTTSLDLTITEHASTL